MTLFDPVEIFLLASAGSPSIKALDLKRLDAAAAAMLPAATRADRPFRIGVWCHYGATLAPHEGIGVFTHNLMHGLLQLNEPVELALLVRPGDQEMVAPLADRTGERSSPFSRRGRGNVRL